MTVLFNLVANAAKDEMRSVGRFRFVRNRRQCYSYCRNPHF